MSKTAGSYVGFCVQNVLIRMIKIDQGNTIPGQKFDRKKTNSYIYENFMPRPRGGQTETKTGTAGTQLRNAYRRYFAFLDPFGSNVRFSILITNLI